MNYLVILWYSTTGCSAEQNHFFKTEGDARNFIKQIKSEKDSWWSISFFKVEGLEA